MRVEVRRAEDADVVAAAAIWWRCDHPNEPFPVEARYVHLAHEHATGELWLATSEDGDPVGFAGTITRSGVTHLCDLFVEPAHHGHGVGQLLLGVALRDAGARTTFASKDPRALPLYVRAGMQPLWPSFYVSGDARRVSVGAMVAEEADVAELLEIDREATGRVRPEEHEYWKSMAVPHRIRDGARTVGFAYLEPPQPWDGPDDWTLDTLAVLPGVDPIDALAAAVAAAVAREAAKLSLVVGGPFPALGPLLDAGFTIQDQDIFLASSLDLVDPTTHLTDSDFC
jgi:GNAT superfamily N-acetyltransferase